MPEISNKELYRRYAALNVLVAQGTAEEREEARNQLSILEQGLSTEVLTILKETLGKESLIAAQNTNTETLAQAALMGKETFDKVFEREINTDIISAIPTVIQVGVDVANLIKGKKDLKKIKDPKLPDIGRKNEILQNQLSESLVRQNEIDPRRRTQREGDIRSSISEANQFARAVGGGRAAGITGSLAGANALRGSRARRAGELEDEDLKTRRRAETRELLRASISEDNTLKKLEFDVFGIKQDRANLARAAATSAINNAGQNLRAELGDLVSRGGDISSKFNLRDIYGPQAEQATALNNGRLQDARDFIYPRSRSPRFDNGIGNDIERKRILDLLLGMNENDLNSILTGGGINGGFDLQLGKR